MKMIYHLFDIMNNSQLYEEKTDPKNKNKTIKEALSIPMSVSLFFIN